MRVRPMTAPALALLVLACNESEPQHPAPGPSTVGQVPAMAPPMDMVLKNSRIVDLTHPLASDIPFFPGGVAFQSEVLATLEPDGYFAQKFTTGEHTGTHVDAPNHFTGEAASVDTLPVESLVGSAAVIDITQAVSADPAHALTVDEVKAWEARHGDLGAGDIVLVRTGWGARWNSAERYRNATDATMSFPGIGVDASTYMGDKGVRGLGIDTLSTDVGSSADFAQHRQFLALGGYCIENLANLEQLPESGATVIVAPLPIVGGSGAPARVLAVVPTGGPTPGAAPPLTPGGAPPAPGGAPPTPAGPPLDGGAGG